MGGVIHKTVSMLVWADIDEGIADVVRYLQTIPNVRTFVSCQGTIGEGGPEPYRAYVGCIAESEAAKARLRTEFDVDPPGDYGPDILYVHPRRE